MSKSIVKSLDLSALADLHTSCVIQIVRNQLKIAPGMPPFHLSHNPPLYYRKTVHFR